MTAAAFDHIAATQEEAALDFCSTEAMGRALGRRVDRLAAQVDDACRTVHESESVLAMGLAVAMAQHAAAESANCAAAVMALIGMGDERLTTRCLFVAQRSRRKADRAKRRWGAVKARYGGES